jgi:hypothetical protein
MGRTVNQRIKSLSERGSGGFAVVHVTGQAVYAYPREPGRTAANCNPDCNPGGLEDPLLPEAPTFRFQENARVHMSPPQSAKAGQKTWAGIAASRISPWVHNRGYHSFSNRDLRTGNPLSLQSAHKQGT